jgi:nucleoside-diphosphate-sugar epimerase
VAVKINTSVLSEAQSIKRVDRVLITGATGFLGSSLVRQAVNSGLSVIVTGRAPFMKFDGADFISADILNPDVLPAIFENVDCVCHVAGLAHVFDKSKVSDELFHAVNVVGAENVVRAAWRAGVKKFIFISSVSVYGRTVQANNEDSECHPEGPYAKSKWEAERLLIDFCQKKGMNLTILRLATLYGEGDPGNVARLIRLIDKRLFIWVGMGENLKSLLYLDDAARACNAVINSPQNRSDIYNVSVPPVTMKDIVETIASALGKSVPSWHVPASLTLRAASTLQHLPFDKARLHSIYNTLQKWLADDYCAMDKFCETFNFQTRVSLEEGIAREKAWCRNGLSK